MYRIAYHLPDVGYRVAKESPEMGRLYAMVPNGDDGTWVCTEHPEGGTFAVWPGDANAQPKPEDFGRPRPCGLGTFYPSLDEPDLDVLIRPEISRPAEGHWCMLSSGVALWIAVAELSEVRYQLLAGGGTKRASTKGRLGVLCRELEELYNRKDHKPTAEEVADLEVAVVKAVIHASYQITDDAIEDAACFHLKSTDINQICYLTLGYDPKGFAAVLAQSRSLVSAAESTESPSAPPRLAPSPDGQLEPAAHPGLH